MIFSIHKWVALAIIALSLSACAVVNEAGGDVTQKFESGITSQGRLLSTDPMTNSFGAEYQ